MTMNNRQDFPQHLKIIIYLETFTVRYEAKKLWSPLYRPESPKSFIDFVYFYHLLLYTFTFLGNVFAHYEHSAMVWTSRLRL